MSVKSGNLLTDITDHLPNFIILTNHSKVRSKIWPKVRIFSEKNMSNFKHLLKNMTWDNVYTHSDVNIAFNKFHAVVENAFNVSFPLKTVSNIRAKTNH